MRAKEFMLEKLLSNESALSRWVLQMQSSTEKEILEKLDQILRVISLQVGQDKSITERARLLKMAGLDNQTIADILNTSVETIRTLTTHLRARRQRRSR
jgi:DNA-binding CsgD family transcriptional regulator